MLIGEAAAKIIEKHPWLKGHARDLESCMSDEADYWQRPGGAPGFREAVETAHGHMLNWLDRAHEFHVDIDDPEDIARFVAGHRRACVWAILISRNHHRK